MMERKKLLRIFGYFFALMLALTAVSRAFASMTVARVQTTSPGNMAIYHEVSVDGTVEAAGEIAVSTEPGQRVSRIDVEEGSHVSAGDVLFEIDRGRLDEQIRACRRELEALDLALRDASDAQKIADRKKQQAVSRAEEDYDAAVRRGDQSVNRAANELDAAYRELDVYRSGRPAVEESGEAQGSDMEKSLLAAVEAAQKSYDDAVNARDESVRTARRAVEDARGEDAPDSSSEQTRLERDQKKRELARLQRLSGQDGRVTAPSESVVTGISVAVGDLTGEGAAVLLADLSRGCRFVADIGSEQAQYVKPHAQVTLTDETQREIGGLEVDSVTSDDEDPDTMEVTVKLPAGELEVGSGARMTVRQKSGTYETCIPIQALNEGGGECFVYVVEETETILGKRLAARKLPVQVADRNESFAALTPGSISTSQRVITSASRPVTEGSPVRLEES